MSRVTLVGERRRVDLVLPSQEPIGLLLPEILKLLGDKPTSRPLLRHLVTTDGSALAHDSTLESARIPDGAVLRLVKVDDAPSAPVVHDVTDETADDLDVRAWRWQPRVRRIVAGLATVGWSVAAGVLARGEFALSAVGGVLVAVAVVAAAVGVLCGRAGSRGLAAAFVVTAGAVGVLGAWTLSDAYSWSGGVRLACVVTPVVVVLLLLGSGSSTVGRGALTGGAAVAGSAVCWEAALWLQSGGGRIEGQVHAGALLTVVSVLVLGVLPRLALTSSGLSGLDDRRSGGASVSRYQVSTALAATHRGLALATVVMAVSAAVAALLVLRSPSVWTVPLAVGVAGVLALRARAFPLITEVVALLVAAAVVTVRLAWVWAERSGAAGPLALLVVLALLPLLVLSVQPAEHVRVRLRRFGDALESAGVISLFPLVIGVFGVYGRLLGTFA
ncbi:EsaB/YukD family protein [Streptomyces sp. NBC_00344]|uniref:EsaB/YukD family protein n=1 Tax=Streptomyces sp. NBC_00344 TaxID=2975720 RepID=UPI002E1E19CA